MERLMKLTVIWKIVVSSKTCASLKAVILVNLAIPQKVLNLNERESIESAKHLIEHVYWTCVIGSSISNEIKQNNATMVKTPRENKKSHAQFVSLEYMNMNSIRN